LGLYSQYWGSQVEVANIVGKCEVYLVLGWGYSAARARKLSYKRLILLKNRYLNVGLLHPRMLALPGEMQINDTKCLTY